MRESGYVMAEQRLRRWEPAFGTCTVDEEAKEFLDMVRTGDGIFSMNAWRKRFGSDGSNVFPPEVLDEQRIGAKNFTGTFTDRSAVEICQERVGERLPAFYYDDDEVRKNGITNLRSLPPPDFVRLSPAYLVDDPGRSRAEDKFIGTRAHPTESLLWYGQRFEIYPIKSVALKSETRRFQVEEPVVEKEEPAEGRLTALLRRRRNRRGGARGAQKKEKKKAKRKGRRQFRQVLSTKFELGRQGPVMRIDNGVNGVPRLSLVGLLLRLAKKLKRPYF